MGTLLSRHYIRYIIIVAHGKSCAHACVPVVYRHGPPPPLPFAVPRILLLRLLVLLLPLPPPSPSTSSVCLVLSLADVLAARSFRVQLRARFSSFARTRSSPPPADVPGFLRYRESFRVRLRATDYRNQATPGSGISTANYNHRFLLVRHFLVFMPLRTRGPADVRPNGSPFRPALRTNDHRAVRRRESLSFGSLHP